MTKYVVIAPNGSEVTVSTDSYATTTFKHGAFMTDDKLAKQYPHIFIPVDKKSTAKPAVEAKEKTKEKEAKEETKRAKEGVENTQPYTPPKNKKDKA